MMLYWVHSFLLWTLCETQFSNISQLVSFQTVKLGDSATIECHMQSSMSKRVWYRVTTGRRLQLVATFNTKYNLSTFSDLFLQRYSVHFNSVSCYLSISGATWEDIGTYYCGAVYLNNIEFGTGTFLMLKGAYKINGSVVQTPAFQSVRPGESVSLNCAFHSDRCAAEHTTVMWLKIHEQSESQMIHPPGFKHNTCERTERGHSRCVYNLAMGNLRSDDAGTYHCVLTSCGNVLFGNGTRIEIKLSTPVDLSPTVIALILANILLVIVALLLLRLQCKSWRKNPTAVAGEGSEVASTGDGVIYASVSAAPANVVSRKANVKNTGDCVVYSDIHTVSTHRKIPLRCPKPSQDTH